MKGNSENCLMFLGEMAGLESRSLGKGEVGTADPIYSSGGESADEKNLLIVSTVVESEWQHQNKLILSR